MICLSISLASYGAPSGCDRLVVCQQAQGDPKTFHYGNNHIPQCIPLSLCVKLVPCTSFDEGSSKTLCPRSRLLDLRHPFFGDVFSSCSSLVGNMLTYITASSWCRIRLVLAPRWVCQGCMALASMGATLKIAVPKHLLMAGCL